MPCDELRNLKHELAMAVSAFSSIKGRPIKIREVNILTTRLELAHEALVKHRSTCLICANAPIEGYVMQP